MSPMIIVLGRNDTAGERRAEKRREGCGRFPLLSASIVPRRDRLRSEQRPAQSASDTPRLEASDQSAKTQRSKWIPNESPYID